MKAFARKAEAEAFADKLRRRGHDVRIETKEVRGRIWHRVRLGSFDSWDEALAAKAEFERAADVHRLHELLCFLRAVPDDAAVLHAQVVAFFALRRAC